MRRKGENDVRREMQGEGGEEEEGKARTKQKIEFGK